VTELDTIEAARKHLKDDPHLAACMIRGLEAVKIAQMTNVVNYIADIAKNVTSAEAVWVLNKVEAVAKALAEGDGDGQGGGDAD
jgi:hypothetical protein